MCALWCALPGSKSSDVSIQHRVNHRNQEHTKEPWEVLMLGWDWKWNNRIQVIWSRKWKNGEGPSNLKKGDKYKCRMKKNRQNQCCLMSLAADVLPEVRWWYSSEPSKPPCYLRVESNRVESDISVTHVALRPQSFWNFITFIHFLNFDHASKIPFISLNFVLNNTKHTLNLGKSFLYSGIIKQLLTWKAIPSLHMSDSTLLNKYLAFITHLVLYMYIVYDLFIH